MKRTDLRAGPVLVAAVLLLPAAFAQMKGPRIVTPRNLATVLGPSTVVVDPGVPDDQVRRLEVLIDGKSIAVLTAPPWEVAWDAGGGANGHTIVVRMLRTDETEGSTSARTSPLRITEVENVNLVNVYALVRDRRGNYISDLTAEDFRLIENGREQRIRRFTAERKPLRVAIVLDTSRTMEGRKFERAQQAALEFVDSLGDGDEGVVVTFDNDVKTIQDITADKRRLSRAIESARIGGGTALYDGIYRAARKLNDFDGRRVMLLLSDGRDEAANGIEPGSLHTFDEALVKSLESEAMIFAIGVGRGLGDQLDFYRKRTLGSILTQLAGDTGGRALIGAGVGELRRAFSSIADDLGHQYGLAYSSDDETADGAWRDIQLQVPGRGFEVITRRGYYRRQDG